MEPYAGLLLDVWREVCRHIEIGESIERLGPILVRRLPIDTIVIRRLDPTRTVRRDGGDGPLPTGPGR